jgi:hypothetical protein
MTQTSQFFHGRKLHYEIYVQIGGRWQLRQALDDGRDKGGEFTQFDFERVEANVLRIANNFLTQAGVQAVKVVRERQSPTGMSLPTEIFRKEAAPTADRSVAKPLAEPLPPIIQVDDLTRRAGARGLSIVLRDFLTKAQVTAIECLHHQSSMKKLAANASLYQAMVHQFATKQVDAQKVPMNQALPAMHKLFDEAQRRARDAQADKRYGLAATLPYVDLYRELAGGGDPDAARFHVFTAIARRLEGTPSHFSRLAWAFDGIEGGAAGAAAELLDELVANCLDDPQFVMDLLGAQPSLAAALTELATVAHGAIKPGPKTPEDVARLSAFVGKGALPLSRTELWDRVVRSVDSTSPLMRKDATREWQTTLDLAAALKEIAPAETWERLSVGFEKRKRALRNRD